MEGNLFARSTWQRFTLSALDARGMRTPEEEARVADQGLCMRLRVRNQRSAGQADDADPRFERGSRGRGPAPSRRRSGRSGSWATRTEEDETPMESVNCKRRSLERAREKELLDESMDLEPTV